MLCRENSQNKSNMELHFCGLYKFLSTSFLVKNIGNLNGRKTAILYFSAENKVDIFLSKANTFRFTVLAILFGVLPSFPLMPYSLGSKVTFSFGTVIFLE